MAVIDYQMLSLKSQISLKKIKGYRYLLKQIMSRITTILLSI